MKSMERFEKELGTTEFLKAAISVICMRMVSQKVVTEAHLIESMRTECIVRLNDRKREGACEKEKNDL